ncbi:MAG: tetratricopeptide repeat protein [Bryobacterales bacterium]|nr:tetratricopeptide repeat protein [Bryobacterales bacterium]
MKFSLEKAATTHLVLFAAAMIVPSCTRHATQTAQPGKSPVQPAVNQAEKLFQQGWQAEVAAGYTRAAEAYEKAVAADPGYAPAWLRLGRVALLQNDPQRALDRLGRALQLNPRDAAALHWRGDAYLKLYQPAKAIPDYQRAAELEQELLERAEIYHSCGLAYIQLGDFKQALDQYSKAVRWRPGDGRNYLDRAMILRKFGRLAEAEQDLAIAVTLSPGNAGARLERGGVFFQLGRFAAALPDLQRAVELDPESALAWQLLGESSLRVKRYDEAVKALTKVAALDPNNPRLHLNLGIAHVNTGRIENALEDFAAALRLRPDYGEAFLERGRAYMLSGRYEKAREDMQQALRLYPASEEARLTLRQANENIAALKAPSKPAEKPVPIPAPAVSRAVPPVPAPVDPRAAEAHWRAGRDFIYAHQYVKAIEELNEAVRLNPGYAEAFNARGFARLLMKEYTSAIADFDSALKLSPRYANAMRNRDVAVKAAREEKMRQAASAAPGASSASESAEARYRHAKELITARQYAQAIGEFSRSIQLRPDYPQAYNARGFTWLLMGEYSRAIADFNQALHHLPDYANAYHNRAVALKQRDALAAKIPPR